MAARMGLLALCATAASGFAPRPTLGATPSRRVNAPVTMGGAKNGIFTPLVKLGKRIVGGPRFLRFRGRVIGAHTKVIQAFVETSDSPFGCLALQKLFELADVDGSGTIDRDELKVALKKLGFTHLKDAQIDQIMKRADDDENCVIDYEEFVKEAPKTLKTNLVKLAKNNGAELGFLS
jgi:hypothetical protein